MQRVERSIRVKAPVDEVYKFWRNFENFPRFMENVEEVRPLDAGGNRSHWKLKGPLGVTVEYDAEITQDDPGKSIGWHSVNKTEGNDMGTSGNVTFAEADGYTVVHVTMQWYDPPAGAVGEAASRVLQDPDDMLDKDLHRFKEMVEGRVGSNR